MNEQSDKLVVDFAAKYTPTEQQAKAHVAEERYILMGGAFRGGKSVWLSAEGIQLSLDFPNNRGYLCRHENKTFRNTTLLTLQEILPNEAVRKHNKQDQYYEFINDSRLYYGGLRPTQSDKPRDRIKSWELGWFGIDEASETSYEFFMMLQSRLNRPSIPATARRGLLASNPEPGWVKEHFIDNPMENSVFIPALPSDNPYNPPTYEEDLRKQWRSNPEWIQRYLDGDWNAPTSLGGGRFYVFTWGMIRSAAEREIDIDPEHPKEMGIDVAGSGVDKTVIYLRHGPVAQLLLDAHITDTMQVVEKARQLIERYEPSLVRVDAIGIGQGVCDRLRQIFGHEKIFAFIAGATAVESERYFNARSEALWLVRERCEKGEISIPDDLELKGQMADVRYFHKADKRIAIESKEDMRKRGMRSPDKLDALALAFGGGAMASPMLFFG